MSLEAVEDFEVLSVPITSSPEMVRPKIFLLIFGFSDLLNSILKLSEYVVLGSRAFASFDRIVLTLVSTS